VSILPTKLGTGEVCPEDVDVGVLCVLAEDVSDVSDADDEDKDGVDTGEFSQADVYGDCTAVSGTGRGCSKPLSNGPGWSGSGVYVGFT
jgi:hypothetical protein